MISDESLKLKSQVCFSLYACARRVARSYAPFLDPLGLTYTQYVTMMVLWEEEQITIRDLCQKLYLDSGTITPVLKKLVNDGYISKSRSGEDERVGIVKLTDKGKELYEKAKDIPNQVCSSLAQGYASGNSEILLIPAAVSERIFLFSPQRTEMNQGCRLAYCPVSS